MGRMEKIRTNRGRRLVRLQRNHLNHAAMVKLSKLLIQRAIQEAVKRRKKLVGDYGAKHKVPDRLNNMAAEFTQVLGKLHSFIVRCDASHSFCSRYLHIVQVVGQLK